MGTLDLYTIGDGKTDSARLQDLTDRVRLTTCSLLDRIDIQPGMSCLDIGCGTADVTFELARRVGPEGRAVGIDIDRYRIEEARKGAAALNLSNVEFLVDDIRKQRGPAPEFDVVYSRFMLDHLAKPDEAIAAMRDRLRPGGVVIAECTDYTGWCCYPTHPAFDRMMTLQAELRRRAGGHPDIGVRLPVLLLDAGLSDVELNIFQWMQTTGSFKRWILMALPKERTDGMIALDIAGDEEIERLIVEITEHIDNPRTAMGSPRCMQVWGYKR